MNGAGKLVGPASAGIILVHHFVCKVFVTSLVQLVAEIVIQFHLERFRDTRFRLARVEFK